MVDVPINDDISDYVVKYWKIALIVILILSIGYVIGYYNAISYLKQYIVDNYDYICTLKPLTW